MRVSPILLLVSAIVLVAAAGEWLAEILGVFLLIPTVTIGLVLVWAIVRVEVNDGR